MLPVEAEGDGVLLRVRVQPRASRNHLQRETDGAIKVYLTAPPVDDAANKALCEYVADRLHLARRQVVLHSGARARQKVLRITGTSAAAIEQSLQQE